MLNLLHRRFPARPMLATTWWFFGAWLAEAVWTPTEVKFLARAK